MISDSNHEAAGINPIYQIIKDCLEFTATYNHLRGRKNCQICKQVTDADLLMFFQQSLNIEQMIMAVQPPITRPKKIMRLNAEPIQFAQIIMVPQLSNQVSSTSNQVSSQVSSQSLKQIEQQHQNIQNQNHENTSESQMQQQQQQQQQMMMYQFMQQMQQQQQFQQPFQEQYEPQNYMDMPDLEEDSDFEYNPSDCQCNHQSDKYCETPACNSKWGHCFCYQHYIEMNN